MAVSIEQAANNGLAAWLSARIGPDVAVETRWAPADKTLPEKAITIIFAGPRRDTFTEAIVEAEEHIHDGVSARIAAAAAEDLATTNAVLNAAKASYELHREDEDAHETADETHAIGSPNATNLPSGIILATELLATLSLHFVDATAHEHPDLLNAPASTSITTLAQLSSAAEAIRHALDRHYVARIYLWRLRDCEQPVQLDVWAQYEPVLDDLIARLEPLLNAAPGESAAFDDDMPVRNGTIVALGDGWPGYADFEFDAPDRIETGDAHQQGEFRAMYRGSAGFPFLVRAQSARLARIALQQRTAGDVSVTSTIAAASPEPTETHEHA